MRFGTTKQKNVLKDAQSQKTTGMKPLNLASKDAQRIKSGKSTNVLISANQKKPMTLQQSFVI